MPCLKVLKGAAPRREYAVGDELTLLGRDPGNAICLLDEKISRRHAEIIRQNGDYFVLDCRSRNGTYLNGKRLDPAVRYPLHEHDQIKVCEFIFEFLEQEVTVGMPLPATSSPTSAGAVADASAADDASHQALKAEAPAFDEEQLAAALDSSSDSWQARITANPESKLRTMIEIARSLHASLDLPTMLGRVLECLLNIFHQADRAVVVLVEAADEQPMSNVVRGRKGESCESVPLSRSILHYVLNTQQAVLSNNVKSDPRFQSSNTVAEWPVQSLMSAPLLDLEGHSMGVVQLDTRSGGQQFNGDDLDLLSSIALQVSLSVEDSRLHTAVLRERAMQRDLEVAREIQTGLLPQSRPSLPGYEFYDFYAPATQVGGDYYDYVAQPGGRLALVLGDASGKGIPAALLMTKLSSEMRVHLNNGLNPLDIMQRVNGSFAERSPYGSFVTLVLATLDPATHVVRIVNAGHMRPLLRHSDGRLQELCTSQSGFPLGVDAEGSYQESRVTMQPGDLLVMYSDGISDALATSDETYGLKRLMKQISAAPDATAEEIGRFIVDDVLQHAGSAPQTDDICLLCVRRNV